MFALATNNTNNAIIRLKIKEDQSGIIDFDTLLYNHEKFDFPSSFDIKNDTLFILANSQKDHLRSKKGIDEAKLDDTYILRVALSKF